MDALDENIVDHIARSLLKSSDIRTVRKFFLVNKVWAQGAFLAVKYHFKLEIRQAIAMSEALLEHNVFMTGGAGTGKSYTTKTITKALRKI